jgi:hypothetical protein
VSVVLSIGGYGMKSYIPYSKKIILIGILGLFIFGGISLNYDTILLLFNIKPHEIPFYLWFTGLGLISMLTCVSAVFVIMGTLFLLDPYYHD